ncbi:hypothetical protein E4U25_006462 [Claviceps purpurea]|nr:hypothetical protein E4U25_006462 [Claviceps purpurea]
MNSGSHFTDMNSTLNSRFTEMQFYAKSTVRHKWRHCWIRHGDRCMLARAGAGQSDMTASTEYSLGHSVWK